MDKKRRPVVLIIIIAALISAAAYYMYAENAYAPGAREASVFTETEVRFPLSFEDMANVYANGGKAFYLSTKDGVKHITSTGAVKWDLTYSMLDPTMKGRGEYAAVSDNKGYVFYMLGPNGPMYEKKYDTQILFFTVNARGDAGVILQEESDYRMFVYNAAGETILEYVHADDSNIPLCMDVSEDGRIAAVSLMDINGIKLSSRVVFFYTAEEGKNYSRTLIGGVECPDLFVAYIYFMAGNKLLYIAEEEIACVDVESQSGAHVAWRLPLSNRLDAFALMGGKGFAVAYGDAMQGKREYASVGTVEIYNMEMTLTGGHEFDDRVTYMSGAPDYLIAAEGRRYTAFSAKGASLWEYTALQETKRFMFLEGGGTGSMVLQTNTSATVIRHGRAAS